MAVYTRLTFEEVSNHLQQYDVGELTECKGITEGVENTNYLLTTVKDDIPTHYILTLFEQRVNRDDLPFFMKLKRCLSERNIPCPRPIETRNSAMLTELKDKAAALIEFLPGHGSPHITPHHLSLVGDLMARMHLAAEDFEMTRANALSIAGWQTLFSQFAHQANRINPDLEEMMADELIYLASNWPKFLPKGVIHADIFPDNVFFQDGNTDQPKISGMIDFYFACNDYWIYDVMVCLNAWCFNARHQLEIERAKALLSAYQNIRPFTQDEKNAMPILARGAAMRFLVTRAHDWLTQTPDALVNPKDPMEYILKLRFHQQVSDYRAYGLE